MSQEQSVEALAKSFGELKRLTDACLSNADDFVKSAKLLLDQNVDHICYHLAALALEEIGKIALLNIQFNTQSVRDSEVFSAPLIDDHTRKLFWAFWGPTFGQTKITKEYLDSVRGYAKLIHTKRIRSLYVDPDRPESPQEKIGHDETTRLVNLAEARVALQAEQGLGEMDEETLGLSSWFLKATDDPLWRQYIVGDESMNKLLELGSTRPWIEWLQEHFADLENQACELMEREFNRSPIPEAEGKEKRWKIKIRLYSASHSIRPKVLKKWNDMSTHIFLYPTNRKDEIMCEFNLLKQMPIKDVWSGLWEVSRLFVLSLNVASQGFFWWYLPREIDSLYEDIVDLENERNIRLESDSRFKENWHHLVLGEERIRPIRSVMLYILRIIGTDEEQPFYHYSVGLALLAKSDLQLNFYTNAFLEFFRTLKVALYVNKHWDGAEDIMVAARRGFIDETEEIEDLDRYLQLGIDVEQRRRLDEVTSKEVIEMKTACDIYFLLRSLEKVRGVTNLPELLKKMS